MGTHSAASAASRRFHGVRAWTIPFIGVAVIAAPLLQASAARASVHHDTSTASLLAQGKKFYKGKTITIIAPDAPGGGFDEYARAVAPVVATYLHAQVIVSNIAPANTITGQDAFNAAKPDGLTVGMINPGSDIQDQVTNVPGVNFNPLRLAFLGASGGGPVEFGCLASSPYKSMTQVIQSTSPVSEIVVTKGSQTVQLRLLNAAFGFPAQVITGYTSTHAEVQGFERGDGNCSVLGIADLGSFIAAGKSSILFRTAPVAKGTAFAGEQANAALLSTLAKKFPAKTNRERLARAAIVTLGNIGHEFNLQTKVSEDRVLAMRAAIQFALTNKTVQSNLLAEGNEIGFISGVQAKADYVSEYTNLKRVASII